MIAPPQSRSKRIRALTSRHGVSPGTWTAQVRSAPRSRRRPDTRLDPDPRPRRPPRAVPRDAFDYIVVDEFHHAAAPTYRRLIDHFRPKFLLGLTATPERTDGGDLLALCEENLVYRCDLVEGVKQDLLCPFRYFGVPDEVDYRNIPWRNTRFDERR